MERESNMIPDKEKFIAKQIAKYRKETGSCSDSVNHSICASCGGKCCKHAPCVLLPCDIKDMSVNGIKEMLDTGYYSLRVQQYNFDDILITMCTRQIDMGRVRDTLLFNTCSLWTENGCPLSDGDRPTGARLLIPDPSHRCRNLLSDSVLRRAWEPYQNVLLKVLFDETQMSPSDMYIKVCRNTLDVILEKSEFDITSYDMVLINHCLITLNWDKDEKIKIL